MSDEHQDRRRRAILAQARRNLENREADEANFAADRQAKARASRFLPGEERDAFQRWFDGQPDPEPPPRRQRLDTPRVDRSEQNSQAWHDWADRKIADALAVERNAERERARNLLQFVVEEVFDHCDAKIAALQTTVDELRNVIKSEGAQVIDLHRMAN
jgi:hypothetical protein